MADRYHLLSLSSGSAPGRGVIVPPGGLVEVLDLRATDADSAQLVTLQASADVPTTTPPTPPVTSGVGYWWPDVVARLTWGVHGATHLAFCDLSAGWQVTLAADFVRLAVGYQAEQLTRALANRPNPAPDAPAPGLVYGAPTDGPPLVVNASAAYGVKPGAAGGLRLTTFLGSIGNGAQSPRIPVPPFARACCVLSSSVVVGGATVTPRADLHWYGGASATRTIAESCDVGGANAEWAAPVVPLGAQSVALRNDSGALMVRPALVWILAI